MQTVGELSLVSKIRSNAAFLRANYADLSKDEAEVVAAKLDQCAIIIEADRQRAAVYKEDDEPLRGDNEPCYYCKSPCSSFAGNPALWPVCLASPEIPGKAEWFHAGCVQSRLRQNEEAVQKAVRETAQRCLVIAFENAGFTPNRIIARIESEFLSAKPEKTKEER